LATGVAYAAIDVARGVHQFTRLQRILTSTASWEKKTGFWH